MKKIIIFICVNLVIILLEVGAMITINYMSDNLGYTLLKQSNKDLGVIFVGGTKDSYDYSLVDNYFRKLNENDKENKEKIEVIELGGEEKYLIVPSNEHVEVEVFKVTFDEDAKESKELVKKMTKPFYITCNESDIFSNVSLKVINNNNNNKNNNENKSFEFSPYISLKDGSIQVPEEVYLFE